MEAPSIPRPVDGGPGPPRGQLLTPRRRRWPWVALAVIVVLAIAVGAVAAWFLNYEPLRANAIGPTFVGPSAKSFGQVVPPDGRAPFTPWEVQFKKGQRFEFGFMLLNKGPTSVTVESIGPGGNPLHQVGVRLGGTEIGPTRTATKHTHAFRPFVLSPQSARWVLVQTRFEGCPRNPGIGSATSLLGVGVTYRLVGVTRHAILPLPYTIRVVGNAGCST